MNCPVDGRGRDQVNLTGSIRPHPRWTLQIRHGQPAQGTVLHRSHAPDSTCNEVITELPGSRATGAVDFPVGRADIPASSTPNNDDMEDRATHGSLASLTVIPSGPSFRPPPQPRRQAGFTSNSAEIVPGIPSASGTGRITAGVTCPRGQLLQNAYNASDKRRHIPSRDTETCTHPYRGTTTRVEKVNQRWHAISGGPGRVALLNGAWWKWGRGRLLVEATNVEPFPDEERSSKAMGMNRARPGPVTGGTALS